MDEVVTWGWAGRPIEIGLTRMGSGPLLVMLPAFSSISTRAELRGLQERLADGHLTVSVDWPGFGDRPRPAVPWAPKAYRAFLRHLLTKILPDPAATIAAGHGAVYLLLQAAEAPGSAGKLCLIAPTWRGPLPSMAGGYRPAFRRLSHAIDLPGIGPLLYRLNVNRPMVGMMARGHVYDDPSWLAGSRLEEACKVINARGARHAAFRFVSGELDPLRSREAMLAAAARINDPILVLYGAHTPAKSRAEIEALAAQANVTATMLPFGKLALHQEYPGEVAEAVAGFVDTLGAEDDRGSRFASPLKKPGAVKDVLS